MPSYQDIETRTRVLEDKVDFIMKAFSVTRMEGIVAPKPIVRTLLDIYREVAALGAVPTTLAELERENAADPIVDRRPDEGLPAPQAPESA